MHEERKLRDVAVATNENGMAICEAMINGERIECCLKQNGRGSRNLIPVKQELMDGNLIPAVSVRETPRLRVINRGRFNSAT